MEQENNKANVKNLILSKKHLLISLAVIFSVFESVMFYLIHISNIYIEFSQYYLCIIAAAVFALLTLVIELAYAKENGENLRDILINRTDGNLIRIAMLFTLIADYFLVVIDSYESYPIGVTVFLGTQISIFLHIFLNDADKGWRIANIATRLGIMVIAVIVACAVMGKDTDYLSIISVIYYANLLSNAVFAHRSGPGGVLLTVGLILFAMCDINVGLSALESIYEGGFEEGSILYRILYSNLNLIWIFYIPSQTLIPLTLLFTKGAVKFGKTKKDR